MNPRKRLIFLVKVVSFLTLPFWGCVKESHLDLMSDTTIIAKIFQPDAFFGKDAIIQSISPDQNFGDATYFSTFSWTSGGSFNTARALIEFDLTSIPVQTQIDSAKLTLFWNSYENLTQHTGDNGFSIYKIWQAWEENVVTWNNQPLTNGLFTVNVPKSHNSNQFYTDIDVSDLVQDMISDPSENHGFMLKLDDEVPYKLVILASSDYSDKGKRPKLVVYY